MVGEEDWVFLFLSSLCFTFACLRCRRRRPESTFRNLFLKRAIPGLFFFIFIFSIHLTVDIQYYFGRWLDSNRGPLVMEASDLPTEPQPLPFRNIRALNILLSSFVYGRTNMCLESGVPLTPGEPLWHALDRNLKLVYQNNLKIWTFCKTWIQDPGCAYFTYPHLVN